METTPKLYSEADRSHIYDFVTAFYTAVRQEDTIGPIFNNAIGSDEHWQEHFETLTDFWMTVLLGVHSYKGNPFLVHRQLPELRNAHFDIWLGIFEQVSKEKLRPELAETAIDKAHRIASSLRQGLFFQVAG